MKNFSNKLKQFVIGNLIRSRLFAIAQRKALIGHF